MFREKKLMVNSCFRAALLAALALAMLVSVISEGSAQLLRRRRPAAATQTIPTGPVTEKEATETGVEAYIYGYSLVTMEFTRRVMTNAEEPKDNHAPMGQFFNAKEYPSASFRDVTAPNADTLYSTAWLDLGKEPYVLSLPDEGDRYFLIPMLSGWTDVFQVPGKRTTGDKAQTYCITGPGWMGPLPAGVVQYKSPTNLVWILGRTYCTGTPEDYKAVHELQTQYKLVPLSAYGKPYTPPAGKVDASIDMKTPVREQVNQLDAVSYFKLMAALMKDNPPSATDAFVLAKMARLGIVPGKEFDPGKLDPAAAKALNEAPKLAVEKIMAHLKQAGTFENGWMSSTKMGLYGADYTQRPWSQRSGWAPIDRKMQFIRPPRPTLKASPTTAPTSTSCTSTKVKRRRSAVSGR